MQRVKSGGTLEVQVDARGERLHCLVQWCLTWPRQTEALGAHRLVGAAVGGGTSESMKPKYSGLLSKKLHIHLVDLLKNLQLISEPLHAYD